MRKYLTFTLVLLSLLTLETRAQNLHDDSIKKIAIADARKFKLDKARLTTFRQSHHNLEFAYFERYRSDAGAPRFGQRKNGFSAYMRSRELTSDYFKPVASAVSDTTLLTDSVYVKAYREKAWQRTRHRRTAGHYVLIAGIVDAGAAVIVLWAYIISIASR
ncbi:hypothetical protein ACPPVU_06670 [Mucilaginibacter sp. McL0603]|uniref:hypothetical protein n=1 Tax=Mucilaginibacter sp. McL0603 TaxID=3415670 RepID=UPI003CF4F781